MIAWEHILVFMRSPNFFAVKKIGRPEVASKPSNGF